jgi:Icc-related predicted phosphoesterase
MKILVIGDPHGYSNYPQKVLKESDLILVTGDVGKADFARDRFFENIERKKKGLEELEYTGKDNKKAILEIYDSTIKVLKKLAKHAPTYFILGNVGMDMIYASKVKKDEKKFGLKLPYLREGINSIENCFFVRNRVRNIKGLRIGFLEYFNDICWNKEFNDKDKDKLKRARKETNHAKKILKNFNNLDFFICHQLPFGIVDKVGNPAPKQWHGKRAGSKVIFDYIEKEKPPYVFCGHIHEAIGKGKIGNSKIYNLGCCGSYAIIDLEKGKVKSIKFNKK